MSAEVMAQLAAADGVWESQNRLEWLAGSGQPHHITARRSNGLWVVAKCGVYRTLDALFDKQREMVDACDIDKDVLALRFGLELRRRAYTWRRVREFDGFDDE